MCFKVVPGVLFNSSLVMKISVQESSYDLSLFVASHKGQPAEYPHQSQHRAQQGVSHQHFQVQVLSGHQWSH